MTRALRSSLVSALMVLAWSPVAGAQSPPVLPSTTTFLADPGIWYAPTAEILRSGRWSVGAVQEAVAPRSYTFEEVYFDLDGFTPRAETLFILDNAARAMLADPTLNLSIEGHTCNIGTAEYNVALADRRANAVRDYLVSRGVSANRLRTASFGEEDPEHANAHKDTRRLNRRVALVVRLEP